MTYKASESAIRDMEALKELTSVDLVSQVVEFSTTGERRPKVAKAELTRRLMVSIDRFSSSTTLFSLVLIAFAVVQTIIMICDLRRH